MMSEHFDPSSSATTMEMDSLGTSPRSSIFLEGNFRLSRSAKRTDGLLDGDDGDDATDPKTLSLSEFLEALPPTIACHKDQPTGADGGSALRYPVQHLFERLDLNAFDWERYALADPSKNYTRNLVATDGESYTLLALVWTPARASHVHDHPCDGCWMRVLRGEVRECRYRPVLGEGEDGKAVPHLECFQDEVYREDEQAVVFIEDCLGYHKVENPSPTQPAVTLHLYSPPFDRCRVWLDKSGGGGTNSRYSSASSSCCARYDSVYGERTGGGTATRTFGAE